MATGIANNFSNVRIGPNFSDDLADFSLQINETINITGFSVDPNASKRWQRRYRFERDGNTFWIPAHHVTVSEFDIRKLNFISHSGLNGRDLLEVLDVFQSAGNAVVSDETAEKLAQHLWSMKLLLEDSLGPWTKDDLEQVLQLLIELEEFGVLLGNDSKGEWQLRDIERVHEAVSKAAETSKKLFTDVYGELPSLTDQMCFKLLYAPLWINRNPVKDINPDPDVIWYASNTNGYEIVLGKNVFFNGQGRVKAVGNRNIFYTSEQLIAHELAHVINWRYRMKSGDRPGRPYRKTLQNATYQSTVSNQEETLKNDDGYGFAARSSNQEYETVTDAIGNLNMNTFTISTDFNESEIEQGGLRRDQLTDLMKEIIEYRVHKIGHQAELIGAIGGTSQSLLRRMLAVLDLMGLDKMDDVITELQAL